MNDFDATICSLCKRARSQHFVIDGGTLERCENDEDSAIYYPYSEQRSGLLRERHDFIRDAMMNGLRGGIGLSERDPEALGEVWDALLKEGVRFVRTWRPQ